PNVDSFIYFMRSTKLWKELENIDNRIKSFPKFVITFFEDSNFRKKMLEYLLNRKSIKHKDDLVLFYPYKEEIDDFLRQS
ncbi:MAG: hypothetical protein N3C61_03310, partial [Candidatus Micrarchaeota archaeon]|nr:hypothetical protein [Candidatus Micrarchaeota archaeon]